MITIVNDSSTCCRNSTQGKDEMLSFAAQEIEGVTVAERHPGNVLTKIN